MKKILIVFVFFFIAIVSQSQNLESFLKSYENGKELFKMERYGLAMQALKPLTSAFNDNPFIKQANFYYAVSAFHENQVEVTISTLNYLKDNYPNWDQMDMVNLWLGKSHLKKNDLHMAIGAFNQIKSSEIRQYASELLLADLKKIEDFDSISAMFNQYPDNKAIAIKMANAISKQPLLDQNRSLLFEIVEKFDLDQENYRIIEQSKSQKKSSYTVAVLLPFMIDNLNDNRGSIRNQFVIDLYQGILLGTKELQSLGIKLNILAYDTESDVSKVRQILSKPELQHVDLIYGPLYPTPVKITNQFSFDYKINMFNPLSNNSQVIGNNPYSFLYHPTYETMGDISADFVQQKTRNKNGFVIFGQQQKDSVMADNFIKAMLAAGDSAITTLCVKESESKEIIKALTEGTEVELDSDEKDDKKISTATLYKIPRDSIGYIYIASESPAYPASVITAMETRGDTTLLVGNESWLNNQIISYKALERLDAYLLAPTFLDKSTNSYRYFENKYTEKYNALPSMNACLGYETTIIIGKLLFKYGNHFQNEFDKESIDGYLFGDYALHNKNDNQIISVVKFKDSQLTLYKKIKNDQ